MTNVALPHCDMEPAYRKQADADIHFFPHSAMIRNTLTMDGQTDLYGGQYIGLAAHDFLLQDAFELVHLLLESVDLSVFRVDCLTGSKELGVYLLSFLLQTHADNVKIN